MARVAVARLQLIHAVDHDTAAAAHTPAPTRHRLTPRPQSHAVRQRPARRHAVGLVVHARREEALVGVLRGHGQQPVHARGLRGPRLVDHHRRRVAAQEAIRGEPTAHLRQGEQLDVLLLLLRDVGHGGGGQRGHFVDATGDAGRTDQLLIECADAQVEAGLAEGATGQRVEGGVRRGRRRGGKHGAGAALVHEHVLQLRVSTPCDAHVVRQRARAGVRGEQVVHLHHRLVDVHQLLQLQLLALVRQLAQHAALLQVRLQLDHALQHLLVRLVLLPEPVVLVLLLTRSSHMHLPARAKHQVRVCVVHVGQRPVPAQQRLAQLLPLLFPVLEYHLAHVMRIHAVELQLLHEQRF